MSHLRIRPSALTGKVIDITPASAGWTYVGFAVHRLAAGDRAMGLLTDRETCLVIVSGSAEMGIGGEHLGIVGERSSPFAGKPWSAYLPPKMDWWAKASTPCEIAVCTAPAKGLLPSRVIAPDNLGQETRGKGTNTRYVTNILPETEPAESLLVVEVITPGGHTSSYPPHKHDKDDFPRETQLEETYYHRLDPRQGFAFQRIYTDDRSIDEAIVVEDGDVTLVPRGYHPCAAVHGYSLYYLNVMAGPRRAWRFSNAREHAWILNA